MQKKISQDYTLGFGVKTWGYLTEAMEATGPEEADDVLFVTGLCQLSDRLDWSSGCEARDQRRSMIAQYFPERDSATTTVSRAISTFIGQQDRKPSLDKRIVLAPSYLEPEFLPRCIDFKWRLVSDYYSTRGQESYGRYRRQIEGCTITDVQSIESPDNFTSRLNDRDREHLSLVISDMLYADEHGHESAYMGLYIYLSQLLVYLQYKYEHMTDRIERVEYLDIIDPLVSQEQARETIRPMILEEVETAMRDHSCGFDMYLVSIAAKNDAISYTASTVDGWPKYEEELDQDRIDKEGYVMLSRALLYDEIAKLMNDIADTSVFNVQAWFDDNLPGEKDAASDPNIGTWDLADRVIDAVEANYGREDLVSGEFRDQDILGSLRRIVLFTIALSGHRGQRLRK